MKPKIICKNCNYGTIKNRSHTCTECRRDYRTKAIEKKFEIWSEGFAATGEKGTACFHGVGEGVNFRDAVMNYSYWHPDFRSYFDAERLTYWGCKLYASETTARASFG